jgi:hypothetical protein
LRKFGFIFIVLLFALRSQAQPGNCILKPPQITIHFGRGNVGDVTDDLSYYRRVPSSCPTDGHYSIASSTSGCFSDDWHTLSEDHTPGDVDGNMLLVNAGVEGATFLRTTISGLKSNTVYELGFWVMNLCRPTKKCPTLILPNLNIRLETSEGNIVANIGTGDLPRVEEPWWTQHRAYFTTPHSSSTLMLVMIDNMQGGCGNDFALDDITFRECVKQTTQLTSAPKATPTKRPSTPKPSQKKATTATQKKAPTVEVISPKSDSTLKTIAVEKQNPKIIPSTPSILRTRENALARRIVTEAGQIKIDIYDNGEIDGDSVTIYHNNALVKSHMRLSDKPISFNITVDPSQPHHEIIMVADNLGSIPPNTSMMIVTTPSDRYQVFISSDEQKNAKVVFDLKKSD